MELANLGILWDLEVSAKQKVQTLIPSVASHYSEINWLKQNSSSGGM